MFQGNFREERYIYIFIYRKINKEISIEDQLILSMISLSMVLQLEKFEMSKRFCNTLNPKELYTVFHNGIRTSWDKYPGMKSLGHLVPLYQSCYFFQIIDYLVFKYISLAFSDFYIFISCENHVLKAYMSTSICTRYLQ